MSEETISIKEYGLSIADHELFERKISIACKMLKEKTILLPKQIPDERLGEICLLSKSYDDYFQENNLSAIEELINNWGGEIIHDITYHREELRKDLNDLSKPYEISIDTNLIDCEHSYSSMSEEEGNEYRYSVPIPSKAIVKIQEIKS